MLKLLRSGVACDVDSVASAAAGMVYGVVVKAYGMDLVVFVHVAVVASPAEGACAVVLGAHELVAQRAGVAAPWKVVYGEMEVVFHVKVAGDGETEVGELSEVKVVGCGERVADGFSKVVGSDERAVDAPWKVVDDGELEEVFHVKVAGDGERDVDDLSEVVDGGELEEVSHVKVVDGGELEEVSHVKVVGDGERDVDDLLEVKVVGNGERVVYGFSEVVGTGERAVDAP
ncbi:hypothetical protein AAC387_Pa07g3846 [Persea americana]